MTDVNGLSLFMQKTIAFFENVVAFFLRSCEVQSLAVLGDQNQMFSVRFLLVRIADFAVITESFVCDRGGM